MVGFDKFARVYTFTEVNEGLGVNSILLIDVRKESEREEWGRIPGAVHVPLSEFRTAFTMDPAAFEEKYDFPMPSRESCSHVVLHCLRGGRSKMGFIILKDLGYKNIGVYEGSFMDWTSNYGRVFRGGDFETMNFEDVKRAVDDNSIRLIDVRTPEELKKMGKIPTAVNLPLREIWRALNLSDEDFKSEFKFMKPAVDATSIVLYCLKGKRAQAAADKMSLLGYTPKVYSGSFHDWKEQGGKILQNNKKGNKKNKS